MEILFRIINKVSLYSPLIPLVFASIQIARGKDKSLLFWIIFISGLSAISEVISMYLKIAYSNNMPWFHTYTLLEGIFVFGFLYSISAYKKLVLSIALLVCSTIVLYTLFLANIFEFNTTSRIIQSLAIMFICITYFYQILEEEEVVFIYESASFWVVVALLVYYCGSFFSFILYQKMVKGGSGGIWIIHNIANLLKYLICTFSILYIKK